MKKYISTMNVEIDSFDAWNFDHIFQVDGEGCIYKMLYKNYRERVLGVKDLVESW